MTKALLRAGTLTIAVLTGGAAVAADNQPQGPALNDADSAVKPRVSSGDTGSAANAPTSASIPLGNGLSLSTSEIGGGSGTPVSTDPRTGLGGMNPPATPHSTGWAPSGLSVEAPSDIHLSVENPDPAAPPRNGRQP